MKTDFTFSLHSSTFFMAGRAVITGLFRGVTRHAGTHVGRHLSGNHVPLANGSVTGLACYACRGMHAMAEVNEIRDPVNANPRNRLLLSDGFRQLLNVRAVGLYRLVTAHAESL